MTRKSGTSTFLGRIATVMIYDAFPGGGMDIPRRVTIAGSLLAEYNRLKGDPPAVSVDDAQDLISDLLHWLHIEGGVSETVIEEEILRMARSNFVQETEEET